MRVLRADGEAVELMEYEIISEPMHHPCFDRMTAEERADVDWAGLHLLTEPQRCVEVLEPLIAKFADFPMLYNFLAVAYSGVRREDESLQLIEETYRRFPKYLFGRVNYALECLRKGQVDEIPVIFERKFALHRLYPERGGRFHVTEFVQFNGVMGLYFRQIGDRETAARYLEMIEGLAPDDQLVRMLAASVREDWLTKFTRMLGRARSQAE